MNSTNDNFITAWEQASEDLGIEIEINCKLNTEGGRVNYPIFVKYFGKKTGTLVTRLELLKDDPIFEIEDFYLSAVSADSYSHYNREHFIETLEDWGYFGPDSSRPFWYIGKYYQNG